MINPRRFLQACEDGGVHFFTGVPDSLMKNLCNALCALSSNHLIAANEGAAIGLAAGNYLATGNTPVVYLQNSGIGNTVNPLLSLADREVYGIPMLLLVGWRGQPGTSDEPQHLKQGKVLIPMLDAMEIEWDILPIDETDALTTLNNALYKCREKQGPRVILVQADSFEKSDPLPLTKDTYELTREAAIKQVANSLNKDDIVVSTTGKASRELYEHRMSSLGVCKDFLTVGSMGHTSQIALGIAKATPNKLVYCFDGDGSLIMHLGGLPVIGQSAPKNFRHILLNNYAHESVGGQPTAARAINFPSLAKSCGYRNCETADTRELLCQALLRFRDSPGPTLLEICVSIGSRQALGRPETSPTENKKIFMEHVSHGSA
ncbi:phosphonopyruvate decarboxylase [bacterium]|nr:phosphonopyruvate decarboxylase [bacterium]MDB4810134.1 phosphonopyruvate decarboxylase [bacterium]